MAAQTVKAASPAPASAAAAAPQRHVLLIDNYDSFTFNIFQYLSELGARVTVVRNDALSVDECERLAPDAVVISPGPGYPAQAGITCEVIRRFAGKVPVLGVCLGHQGIFEVFGGRVVRCGEIVHGKVSSMQHDGKGVFAGVPQGFLATRYHSLVGDPATLPAVLEVTARCAPKSEPNAAPSIIQGVRHREFTVEGVQFHPESITTEHGKQLLRNFLALRGGKWSR